MIIGVLVGVVILLQPSGTKHLEVEHEVENGVPLESLNKISYEDTIDLTLRFNYILSRNIPNKWRNINWKVNK